MTDHAIPVSAILCPYDSAEAREEADRHAVRVERMARRIAQRVHAGGEVTKQRDVDRMPASKERHLMPHAINHALLENWIIVTERGYRPGGSKPSVTVTRQAPGGPPFHGSAPCIVTRDVPGGLLRLGLYDAGRLIAWTDLTQRQAMWLASNLLDAAPLLPPDAAVEAR